MIQHGQYMLEYYQIEDLYTPQMPLKLITGYGAMLFRPQPPRFLSPDTDVYNIGLSMPRIKQYIVQLNIHSSIKKKYLMLNNLMLALQTDPDLYTLPRDHLGSIMQSLYISTGCDYISYIKTFGKATILTNFTQHANFIDGTVNNGSLYQTDPDNKENGFLSFMLVYVTLKSILLLL